MPGPLIGAHVSTAGGHFKAFERAQELGCEALQIFTRAPSRWRGPDLKDAEVEQFHRQREAHGNPPVIAHDIYLSNLAGAKDDIRQRSIDSMLTEIERCHQLGLDGLVCHMGSHPDADEGLQRYSQALAHILEKTEKTPIPVLLETTAGQGTNLGYKLEHLARVIELNDGHPRLGVCLDTCHVFAAGYDLREGDAYEDFWHEFDQTISLDRLKALHLNDSKKELGSRVDRHEHIGAGEIGEDAFRRLVCDQRFDGLPMVIETPEMKTHHALNVSRLKALRSSSS